MGVRFWCTVLVWSQHQVGNFCQNHRHLIYFIFHNPVRSLLVGSPSQIMTESRSCVLVAQVNKYPIKALVEQVKKSLEHCRVSTICNCSAKWLGIS